MERSTSSGNHGGAWATWVAFAGVMLMLIGVFNVIGGLAAVFSDQYWAIEEGRLFVFDFTIWGIILMVFGVLMIAGGWGLVNLRPWARWFSVVLAFWNAAGHIVFFPAQPLLSTIMIAVDIAIIYALTVRWGDVVESM